MELNLPHIVNEENLNEHLQVIDAATKKSKSKAKHPKCKSVTNSYIFFLFVLQLEQVFYLNNIQIYDQVPQSMFISK